MFALIRIAVLFAVIFGVAFGVAHARRSAAHKKRIAGLERELKALSAGLKEGLYSKPEYDQLTQEIITKCEQEGIQVPPL